MRKFTNRARTGIIIFAVLFVFGARAQENIPLPMPSDAIETIPLTVPGELTTPTDIDSGTMSPASEEESTATGTATATQNEQSQKVLQDMRVTIENLDAKKATIKPGSFFHPFKRLGRNIQEAFTFDPAKDAELKLQHANQELSEIQDLIEEKGIINVDPKVFTDSINWFESKMEKIKDASPKLKKQKNKNPGAIENLLNNLADKQIKEHKVLESFNEKITDSKEKITGGEDLYVALKNTQNTILKHFGEVLTQVDEQERIPERLSEAANNQKGSEFKLIKNAEILKKLEKQAPEETKEAIGKAQTKTNELFQEDVKAMPAVIRAEKFKAYTDALPGDETVQLSVFEDLKQLPNIPQDMLKKIEEVKEFAVKRFEVKMAKFEKPEIQEKFFENLGGDSLDDIMVLEELKAKITAKQEALKKKIDQRHTEGMEEFKKKFTDVQSQEQAKNFEKLVKEMTANPNPKTLKLINDLEIQVAQNPEKKAFIEEIKNKTKAEMETKFRQEGERFFDRMSSLNPEDMTVFQKMEQDQFYDPKMMKQFSQFQTTRFKEYVQGIDNAENFERFNERFGSDVVQIIKTRDAEFGDAMQYKSRKIAEAEMQLKENKARMKMELEWKKSENDFQMKLMKATNNEAKKALYEEKRQKELSLVEMEFADRQKIMAQRMAMDPFCDEKCQVIQKQFFEQDLNYRKQNILEDARMKNFEMELRTQPAMGGNDPFQGKCNSPETCMKFCKENPAFSACQMFGPMQMPQQMQPPLEGQIPGIIYTNNQMYNNPPPCPMGQINMPKGPGQWVCTDDPYQKISETFKKCGPGYNWNDGKGFCEFNQTMFASSCPQGEYWNEGRKTCIRPGMPQTCPPSQYWDHGKQACVTSGQNPCPPNQYWDQKQNGCIEYKTQQTCPQGQYWDTGLQTCSGQEIIKPMPILCGQGEYWDNIRGCVRENFQQCLPGQYFDFYEKICKTDQWKSCPMGEYWDAGKKSCIRDVTAQPVEQCAQGYFWDFYKKQCVKDMYMPPPTPVTPPQACTTVMPPQCKPGETPTYGNCGPSCTIQSSTPSCPSGQWWDQAKGTCTGQSQPCPQGEYWDTGKNACMRSSTGQTPCPTGEYWNQIENRCISNSQGTACPTNYEPICGNDNKTYSNDCEAKRAGIGIKFYGKCETATTPPVTSGYCGDKICNNGETSTTCSSDCKTTLPPPTTTTCPVNSYTTSSGSCNYNICPNGCNFNNGCPNGCVTGNGTCGNNICEGTETSTSCPSDCGNYYPPPTSGDCGNNACDVGETPISCPSDCGGGYMPPPGNNIPPPDGYCGDSMCNNGEYSESCPSDCGTPPPPPGSIFQTILRFFSKLFGK